MDLIFKPLRRLHAGIVWLCKGLGMPDAFVLRTLAWWWIIMGGFTLAMGSLVIYLDVLRHILGVSLPWSMDGIRRVAGIGHSIVFMQFAIVFLGLFGIRSIAKFSAARAKMAQVLGGGGLYAHAMRALVVELLASIFLCLFSPIVFVFISMTDPTKFGWGASNLTFCVVVGHLLLAGFALYLGFKKLPAGLPSKVFGLVANSMRLSVEDRFNALPAAARQAIIQKANQAGLDTTKKSFMRAAVATHEQDRKKALEQARLLDEETTPSQAPRPVSRL